MDKFIAQIIEESFASKKQQRYFYTKANDKTLSKKERQKWGKMAKEFSSKTNFKKLPEVADEELDEIVDDEGNIINGTKPADLNTKGVTSKLTTDDSVGMAHGMMGNFGIGGATNASRTLKYWAEADMSKALGYEDTMGNDENYETALDHFENELGLSDDEAEERAEKMGYDEELPDGKIRLIENPTEYIKEYLDNILKKRSNYNDIVNKNQDIDEDTLNPIIKRQLNSLKQTISDNNINIEDILKYLRNEQRSER